MAWNAGYTAIEGIVGYDAQPAGMQIAFFVTAIIVIWAGMTWSRRRFDKPT